MALSGSFTGTTNSQYVQPKITWSATQSISGNYSDVTATLTYSRTNTGYTTSGTWSGNITINGVVTTGSKSISVTYNSNTTALTATTRVYHNTDGTKSITISASGGISPTSVSSTNCSGTITLDTIPRGAKITDAKDISDEQNPSFTFSNPAGFNLRAVLEVNPNNTHLFSRTITNTGSYTFELTESERNTLRSYITGSNTATLRYLLYSKDDEFISYADKKIIIVNGEPTITPAVVDMNDVTADLTGDINTLIKGYSTAACSISAEAKKGATITSYQIVNGVQTSSQNVVAFYNVESGSFTFTATDSRRNVVTQTITKPFINYFKPSCNQEAEIVLSEGMETEATVKLKITGSFFNGSFGAVENTATVQIRHKTGNGEFTEWLNISDFIWETVTDGNTYSVEGSISGLPYDESFTIQSRVIDALETVQTASYTLQLTPVFDWGKDGFNFNVPVAIQNNTLEDFIIETYTEPMGTNGTWYVTKWKSGKAECYGTRNFGKAAITTPWGSMYESSTYTQYLPEYLFAYPPECVQITLGEFGAGVWLERGISAPTVDDVGEFCFVRPTAYTTDKSDVSFYIVGQWKD